MVVTVRLHATLRRAGPDGTLVDRVTLELAPGATVRAVLDALGLAVWEDAVLLVVNHRVAGEETSLADGDEVRLMPAMSGGGRAQAG